MENYILQIFNQFGDLLEEENLNNLAPIFHKKLDQHTGIQVSGRFNTTDDTEFGEMSYITAMRNASTYAPHDGFGIAWKKQPAYLIDCANNGLSATDAHQTDFYEVYGVTVTEAITQLGSAAALKEPDNGYLKYNVYLVDNDILQEEVWISTEKLWDQTGGKNQFLQAAKVWIEPNTWYEYNFKIYEKLAVDAWVWDPLLDPAGDSLLNENRTLSRGQTYPPYVPQAAGDHFGIAVAQTRNNEWYYDNLLIRSFAETFPMQLFKFKPTSEYFTNSGPLTLTYYGVGYDPTQYAIDDAGHSRTRLWVRNYTTSAWEYVGGHTATIDGSRAEQRINGSFTPLSDYKDLNGYINVLAHAANSGPRPGAGYDINQDNAYVSNVTEYDPETQTYIYVTNDFSEDSNHSIRTYYASCSNFELEGVHKGNSIDVYCHEPSNIQYGVLTTVLTGNNLYIQDLFSTVTGPIQEITALRLHLSQTELDEDSYSIASVNTGYEFSTDANYKISFNTTDDLTGTIIDIIYKYWATGDDIESFINSDEHRFPGTDYLVKTMPPAIVNVSNLSYSGGLEENLMREALAAYINALTDTRLDKSDIVAFLYTQGADFVDTDMSITIRRYSYNYDLYTDTLTSTSYEIPSTDIGRFYTDKQELLGLNKI